MCYRIFYIEFTDFIEYSVSYLFEVSLEYYIINCIGYSMEFFIECDFLYKPIYSDKNLIQVKCTEKNP